MTIMYAIIRSGEHVSITGVFNAGSEDDVLQYLIEHWDSDTSFMSRLQTKLHVKDVNTPFKLRAAINLFNSPSLSYNIVPYKLPVIGCTKPPSTEAHKPLHLHLVSVNNYYIYPPNRIAFKKGSRTAIGVVAADNETLLPLSEKEVLFCKMHGLDVENTSC